MEYISPGASLDFQFNAGAFLADGETITGATWTAETGLTVGAPVNATQTSTAQITAGASNTGKTCKVEVEVDTNNSNTFRRTWFVKIQEQLA